MNLETINKLAIKARTRALSRIAGNWDKQEIESFIQTQQLINAVMLEDRCLFIGFYSVPPTKLKNPPVYKPFIIATSAPSYNKFLEIAGIAEPGEEKIFVKLP